MKTLCLILMGLAASVVINGTALAQDKSASHQGGLTNSTAVSFSMNLKPAPTLLFGPNLAASGLVVDFIQPQQTWPLFNPLTPAPALTAQTPNVNPPAIRHPKDDDLVNHEANFVFLKLSFR
jgi:hypothetical protein